MITCRELTSLVTEYLEGRLSLWQRVQFELHVGMCSSCRAYLGQMRETVRVLGELPEVELPADVEAELLDRFKSWQKPVGSVPIGPPDGEPDTEG